MLEWSTILAKKVEASSIEHASFSADDPENTRRRGVRPAGARSFRDHAPLQLEARRRPRAHAQRLRGPAAPRPRGETAPAPRRPRRADPPDSVRDHAPPRGARGLRARRAGVMRKRRARHL